MQYYIRQHKKHVSGPHQFENIRQWIREGKVRDEMEFSEDGETWTWGVEMLDLFPVEPERRLHRSK